MKPFKSFLIEDSQLNSFQKKVIKKYGDNLKQLILTDVTRSSVKMFRLSIIQVGSKESGIGTKIMKDIVDFADDRGYIVVLNTSDDYGSNIERLTKFYERFGFMRNEGKTKMPGLFEKMFRLPN